MKRANQLSHAALVEIVEAVQQTLYLEYDSEEKKGFWSPDKEWDSETPSMIAAKLEQHDMIPDADIDFIPLEE